MIEYLQTAAQAPTVAKHIQRQAKPGQIGDADRSDTLQLQHAARPPVSFAQAAAQRGAGNRQINELVQRRAAGEGAAASRTGTGADRDPAEMQRTAQEGLQGSGAPLPHLERIQRSFGKHDVSRIRAYIGGKAAEASQKLQARAYATGEQVAFERPPDLPLAAHEAAHVVQQRSGATPQDGVGQEHDEFERAADRVAEAVAAQRSAEPLLPAAADRPVPAGQAPVQLLAFRIAGVAWDLRTGEVEGGTGILASPQGESPPLTTEQVQHALNLQRGQIRETGTPNQFRIPQAGVQREVRRLLHEESATPQPAPTGSGSGLAELFNREFASILQPFQRSGTQPAAGAGSGAQAATGVAPGSPAAAGPAPGAAGVTEEQLRRLFTAEQLRKLRGFCTDHVIPNRLFNGDDVQRGEGAATPAQRSLVASHILANGLLPAGTPGADSRTGRIDARCCRHWARMVQTYAGVAPRQAEGVEENFDHAGNLVLNSGQNSRVRGGTVRQESIIPLEAFQTEIRPGDWIQCSHSSGTHSLIFSEWADTNTHGGQYRTAICFSQLSNTNGQGGRQHQYKLGPRVAEGGICAVYAISHPDEQTHSATTEAELLAHLEQGTDPGVAEANQQYLTTHAVSDVAGLEEWLRTRNREHLALLRRRMTPQQQTLLTRMVDQASTTPGERLELLVRLHERLSELASQAAGLDAANQSRQPHAAISSRLLQGDPVRRGRHHTTGRLRNLRPQPSEFFTATRRSRRPR